jgi:CHAT domain-containing protein
MTLSIKGLLLFNIATILHGLAFSREATSALSFYLSFYIEGELLSKKDPGKAFKVLGRLMQRLLIFIIIFVSYSSSFSQSDQTALLMYQRGQSLVKKNPDKAYPVLVEAMKFSKQNNARDVYINAVNRLASLAFKSKKENQKKEVFGWVKEAIEISKDAKKDTALAELHYNVAEFYNTNYEIELPIYHYEIAIKIWTSLIGEWNKQVAKCYHGLGDVYKYYKFDFLQAEQCYEKALFIREKIKFPDTPILFLNYYSLAATNRSQHDFEKALSYGHKTLELAQQLNNIKTVEMSNGMVANIYRDMEQSVMAKKYYHKAIAINRETNNLGNRAWYYLSIGELLKNEGKLLKKDSLYDEALLNFLISYTIYTKYDVGDKLLFINLLIDMADAYSLKHDDKKFFKVIKEVFQILSSLDKLQSKEAYTVYLLLGDYHNEKKKYDSALFYYQKALTAVVPSFHSLNPNDNPSEGTVGFVYYIYEGLAKKASVLKNKFLNSQNSVYLQQSIDCLRLAEKLVSHERNTLDMEDAKWEFLDANYDLYEDILTNLYDGIKVLPKDTVHSLAFRYFEQSKSRSLADALTQTEQTKQINKDSLFRLNAELKRKLFNAQYQINQELEKVPGSKKIPKLRNEIVLLDRSIQVCKEAIEIKYPGYFNVKYGYQPPALKDVQQVIDQRESIIIEYFWGTEWVYAIGINETEIQFKRIGKSDSIKAIINAVLSHLDSEHSSMNRDVFHLFTFNARRLYEKLVDPFKPLLPSKGRVQIIPDGPIGQVPFEILLEENVSRDQVNYRSLKYMIKSFAIGYAYSSSMLINKTKRVVRRPSLLAVGFTGGQGMRSVVPNMEEIQGAEQELEALAKRFDMGKFLVGHEATEANFKTLSPDFDIIHLAVHGTGDVKKNFSASLYFRSMYDSLDDGELHAYELYGLKLKALMAVLSSCESGLGKGYKGEGMISMASAFTYSGCQNILMSLWKVNDQASTILMDDFYGQLLEGKTIDYALREVKLNYLETADELTADPKIWAPLVAYGSLEQIFQKDRSRIYIILAIGILLILLLFFKFKKEIL